MCKPNRRYAQERLGLHLRIAQGGGRVNDPPPLSAITAL
jgi:hypothetical protein